MSAGFFSDEHPGAVLLIAALIIIPCTFVIARMIESPDAAAGCDIAAAQWSIDNFNSEANRATGPTYLAGKYSSYRTACPNGYKFVDERKIAAVVKAGYVPTKN